MQKAIFFRDGTLLTNRSLSEECGCVLKEKNIQYRFCLLALLGCGVFLVAWDLRAFPDFRHAKSEIPFSHALHGENLGLDCSKCHPGAYLGIRATMPSRADCMDCHNLPLSESSEIERLAQMLPNASERPFAFESQLPSNVFFPHGLHARISVSCETCHGTPAEIDAGRRPKVRMQECLACHREEQSVRDVSNASSDCARCHR